MRLKYIKSNKVLILLILILQSCVSKKQVLYVQDLINTDVSKVSSSFNTFQENDIIKIDVSSMEMKASAPFNKIQSEGIGGSLVLMQLSGYLVSNNKTIIFPVL